MTRRWLRRWQTIRRGLRPQTTLVLVVHAGVNVEKLAVALRRELNRQRVGGGVMEARP